MTRSTFLTVGIFCAIAAIVSGGVYFIGFKNEHSFMSHAHDEARMPGLRGPNVSQEETADMELMFRQFETITREVENLPDGIRTTTRSSDEKVMDAIVNHSVGMIERVGRLDDPKLGIQSPTLDVFFLRGERIVSTIDVTDDGLVIVQTSDDPQVVVALHKHAAEVSDMVDHGMAAVHDRMETLGQTH